MRFREIGVSVSVLLTLGGVSARAQVLPSPPAGSVAVIRPTDNGYDDLMAACAALAPAKPAADTPPDADAVPPASTALDRAQNQGATLADKRAALRDPRVQNALALLRAALTKPRIEPPLTAAATDLFPAMARLRELARVLAIEEYVQLADGSTASAIDTLDESLALADATQHWSMVSAMVGQAMTAIAVKTIATHLDRLSAGDCSRLVTLLRTELDAPNPAIVGIRRDSVEMKSLLKDFFATQVAAPDATTDAADADEATSDSDPDAPTAAELRAIRELQTGPSANRQAFLDTIVREIDTQNEALAAQLAAYPDAPSALPEDAEPTTEIGRIAVKFAHSTSLDGSARAKMIDKSVTSRAQLRLLAVHAAIHQYRWEHNALPDSLSGLKVGALANDPFVSKGTMLYERAKDGKSYTLSCAGPPARDAEGKIVVGGKREAVGL